MSQLYPIVIVTHKHDDEIGLIDAAMRVGFYASIIVILALIIVLIIKLMRDSDDDGTGQGNSRATETSSLLLWEEETVFISYGTNKEDLESGKVSCNSSSSDYLYEEKICAICYDDQSCCSFVPCGHCVTCFTCAKRIIKSEVKSCPMCRTIIHKVKKLRII